MGFFWAKCLVTVQFMTHFLLPEMTKRYCLAKKVYCVFCRTCGPFYLISNKYKVDYNKLAISNFAFKTSRLVYQLAILNSRPLAITRIRRVPPYSGLKKTKWNGMNIITIQSSLQIQLSNNMHYSTNVLYIDVCLRLRATISSHWGEAERAPTRLTTGILICNKQRFVSSYNSLFVCLFMSA